MNYDRRPHYGIAQRRRHLMATADANHTAILTEIKAYLLRRGFDLEDVENPGFTILEALAQQLRDYCHKAWLVRPAIIQGMDLWDAANRVAVMMETRAG